MVNVYRFNSGFTPLRKDVVLRWSLLVFVLLGVGGQRQLVILPRFSLPGGPKQKQLSPSLSSAFTSAIPTSLQARAFQYCPLLS